MIKMLSAIIYLFLLTALSSEADKPCIPRKYNYDSFVCVCNATYCDEISKIQRLPPGKYLRYSSDKDTLRFNRSEGLISKLNPEENFNGNIFDHFYSYWLSIWKQDSVVLKVDKNTTYQKIVGFGAGFTDSSGINMKNASASLYNHILRSYFSKDGLEFNLGRVPIGGTDYSTHAYAYNMLPEDDYALSNFSLSMEDYQYKIPVIKDAQKMATNEIYLICAVWSPPLWMKLWRVYNGVSYLKYEFYQTYADYHLRFLEEYKKVGLKFWAMSTSNEPINGNSVITPNNALGWIPQLQAMWIERHFCPTIRRSKFSDIKILALDDNTMMMTYWLDVISKNKKAWNCIDGIALHYYTDHYTPSSVVEEAHEKYSNKFIIHTESTAGEKFLDASAVKLPMGKWSTGEYLMEDMIRNFNIWTTGWVDWNLALDLEGGPYWSGLGLGAMGMVDADKDEFLKQPGFYAMGHFSKFVPRGSVRIKSSIIKGSIYNVAFRRPDNGTTIVIYNPSDSERQITITDEAVGVIEFKMSPCSFHSVVYWI